MSVLPEIVMSLPRPSAPRRVCALALVSFTLTPCLAAVGEDEATIPQMEPIIVTAARSAQPLSQAMLASSVMEREDIAASGAPNALALLRDQAGLEITQSGGEGQLGGLLMRGEARSRVLILVDGMRIETQGPGASGAALEQLSIESIERIEITRGNVAALYGANAVGGVIQITTRNPKAVTQGSLSAEAGSENTQRFSARAAGSAGSTTRLALSASSLDTDGISATNEKAGTFTYNPDRDPYRNRTWNFALTQDLPAGHELRLKSFEARGTGGFDNGVATTDTFRNRLFGTSLQSVHPLNKDWRAELALSRSGESNRNYADDVFGYGYESQYDRFEWRNHFQLAPKQTLSAGIETEEQSLQSDTPAFGKAAASYHRNARALWLGTLGQFGANERHEWQAQARRDEVGPLKAADTWLAGYAVRLTPQWRGFVNHSTSFTAPNLAQLNDSYVKGNKSLMPEYGEGTEAGVSWNWRATEHNGSLRLTLFDASSRDASRFNSATSRFENIATFVNQGAEIMLNTEAQFWQSRWNFTASLTQQKPEEQASAGAPYQAALRRAETFGSLTLRQSFARWSWGASLHASGARPDVFYDASFQQHRITLAPYTLLDLQTSFKLGRGFSLTGKLANAADVQYETVYGYNMPGRVWSLGLRWDFGQEQKN